MTNPLPIPDELWNKIPADAQAALAALFLGMERRIVDLESKVRDLEARLKLNSTNSSKPPSSDPIGMKRKPPTPPSGRKRGGQPGHRKSQRSLVPPEKVRDTICCKPTTCRRCGHGLSGNDPEPGERLESWWKISYKSGRQCVFQDFRFRGPPRRLSMLRPILTPEQQAEAQRISEILMETARREVQDIAELLAAKPDHQLLGKTEFEVRDRVHKIGAKALETALNERKKGATKGPA
jgi:Family of unknown function (DUF6444)